MSRRAGYTQLVDNQKIPDLDGYQQQGPPTHGGYQQLGPTHDAYQQSGLPPQGGYQKQGPPFQGGYQEQQGAAPPQEGKYIGEVPDQDVREDSTQGDCPPPSAPPPLSDMDHLQGYENTQFQADTFVPPPAYQETISQSLEKSAPVGANTPTISEEVARAALTREVSNHCCYGKSAARDLDFTNMIPSSAFHYQLETFTEGRKPSWGYTPYTGQPIDGPENGPPPGPWDINIQPGEMFKDNQKVLEVPHTASVKICYGCIGMGTNRCWKCLGRGQVICSACDGAGSHLHSRVHHDHHHHHGHHHRGHHHHGHHHHGHHHHGGTHVDVERVPCFHCHGSGRKRCSACYGCGQTTCSTCDGKQQLKCYIKLTVTWTNNKADHIVERTALPDNLIRRAQGRMVFQDTQPRVCPVIGFPDNAVNTASKQLVDSHAISFPMERILSQRHWVRTVPVMEACCDFKGKRFSFWIFGDDNNIYAPDYPQQTCWGCSIL